MAAHRQTWRNIGEIEFLSHQQLPNKHIEAYINYKYLASRLDLLLLANTYI